MDEIKTLKKRIQKLERDKIKMFEKCIWKLKKVVEQFAHEDMWGFVDTIDEDGKMTENIIWNGYKDDMKPWEIAREGLKE